jgi:hypothetical protein
MTYKQLTSRKSQLFIQIMTDKYNGKRTPYMVIKEYRFLQREQKRQMREYKGVA